MLGFSFRILHRGVGASRSAEICGRRCRGNGSRGMVPGRVLGTGLRARGADGDARKDWCADGSASAHFPKHMRLRRRAVHAATGREQIRVGFWVLRPPSCCCFFFSKYIYIHIVSYCTFTWLSFAFHSDLDRGLQAARALISPGHCESMPG